MKTVKAVISGRVQGVGYRAWALVTARSLGLSGWVRNRKDGTVEAVFHGEAETVARMVESCKRGSMLAKVASVEIFPWDEAPQGFTSLPTL